MPHDGAFHCFMNNIVLGKKETNDKIIRIAEASRWLEANRLTPDEVARQNFARVEEFVKKELYTTEDDEME